MRLGLLTRFASRVMIHGGLTDGDVYYFGESWN